MTSSDNYNKIIIIWFHN